MTAEANRQYKEIMEIGTRLKDEGIIQDILLTALRVVGPSRLNRNQYGEQKTITIGGTERMVYSSPSKWAAMIERIACFREDYLQTKKIDEFIAEKYADEHPGTTAEEQKQIAAWVAAMFKGKKNGEEDGKMSVIVFANTDLDGIMKTINLLVDKYGITAVPDDQVKKLKIEVDPEIGRSPSPLIAMNGSFGKDDIMHKFHSARKMAMAFSVNAYHGEKDDLVARDHMEKTGAGHMNSKDCNAAIMYESILLEPLIYITNHMWGKDYHNPALWNEAIEECKRVLKDVMDAFISEVPSSDQHNMMTGAAPIAICVKVGNVHLYTAQDRYYTAVDSEREEDDALNRLLSYIDDEVFYKKEEKRYWLEIKKSRIPELETVHIEKNLEQLLDHVLDNIGE